MKKLLGILVCLILGITHVIGQSKSFTSPALNGFKELLNGINATFNVPENFVEIKPANSEKLTFQYGLKIPDADFEIWFQVNSVKGDWQRYEANKQLANPDSSYNKIATDEALVMSGSKDFMSRPMPAYILDRYNADEGRSYLITLAADMPATKHYQYALIIVLHKNHYGNIVVACLTNEKGPTFFKNINQLRYCFKFNG